MTGMYILKGQFLFVTKYREWAQVGEALHIHNGDLWKQVLVTKHILAQQHSLV